MFQLENSGINMQYVFHPNPQSSEFYHRPLWGGVSRVRNPPQRKHKPRTYFWKCRQIRTRFCFYPICLRKLITVVLRSGPHSRRFVDTALSELSGFVPHCVQSGLGQEPGADICHWSSPWPPSQAPPGLSALALLLERAFSALALLTLGTDTGHSVTGVSVHYGGLAAFLASVHWMAVALSPKSWQTKMSANTVRCPLGLQIIPIWEQLLQNMVSAVNPKVAATTCQLCRKIILLHMSKRHPIPLMSN